MFISKVLLYAGILLSLFVAIRTITSKKFWSPRDFRFTAGLFIFSAILLVSSHLILERKMVPYVQKMPPGKYTVIGFHLLKDKEKTVEFALLQENGRQVIVRSTADKFDIKPNKTNKPNFAVFKPKTNGTQSYLESILNSKTDIFDIYYH